MDFLDPNKKRAHAIRLYIGYVLITIALLLASTLLLLAAFGYSLKGTSGEIIQNGLVFVDAHPQQAEMYLNGQDKGGTDGRFVLEAGQYNLELKRDGYRSWKRDFTLDGGVIVRLVYPFLFPEKLDNRDVLPLATPPDVVSASPDRNWIVVHQAANPRDFVVVSTNSKELETTTVSVPAAVLAGHTTGVRMEAAEWSTDNRHLLLQYSYEGGYDYLLFDREEPDKTINISQLFGRSFTKVTLRDKNAGQLYLYAAEGGILQAAVIKDKSTVPVATNVIDFWPYKDNTILYATNLNAPADKTLIRLKEGQVTYDIRQVARSPKYLLNMAEFDGATYVTTGATVDGKVYIYKNPIADLKQDAKKPLVHSIVLRVNGAETLSFSNNARFIALQGGSRFYIYDLETKRPYSYDTGLVLAAGQKATWMDGHRLTLVSQGKMYVFDYDGINRQELVSADAGYAPLFDRDYNQLFTVGPRVSDSKQLGLIRTDLNLGRE